MNSSIWIDTLNLGWSILQLKGTQNNFKILNLFRFLKIVFILEYSKHRAS